MLSQYHGRALNNIDELKYGPDNNISSDSCKVATLLRRQDAVFNELGHQVFMTQECTEIMHLVGGMTLG